MGIESKAAERVETSRSAYERMLLMVPGYRGYRGRDLIRDTDQLVRDAAALRLKQGLGALKETYKGMVNAGDAGFSEEVDSVVRILDRLHQSTLHAARGYTGRWDGAKILDAQLDRAVEFDSNVLASAQAIADDAVTLRAKPSRDGLVALRASIERLDRTFLERKQAILGLVELGSDAGGSP